MTGEPRIKSSKIWPLSQVKASTSARAQSPSGSKAPVYRQASSRYSALSREWGASSKRTKTSPAITRSLSLAAGYGNEASRLTLKL